MVAVGRRNSHIKPVDALLERSVDVISRRSVGMLFSYPLNDQLRYRGISIGAMSRGWSGALQYHDGRLLFYSDDRLVRTRDGRCFTVAVSHKFVVAVDWSAIMTYGVCVTCVTLVSR